LFDQPTTLAVPARPAAAESQDPSFTYGVSRTTVRRASNEGDTKTRRASRELAARRQPVTRNARGTAFRTSSTRPSGPLYASR